MGPAKHESELVELQRRYQTSNEKTKKIAMTTIIIILYSKDIDKLNDNNYKV